MNCLGVQYSEHFSRYTELALSLRLTGTEILEDPGKMSTALGSSVIRPAKEGRHAGHGVQGDSAETIPNLLELTLHVLPAGLNTICQHL